MSLIDVEEIHGNADQLVKDLNEAANQRASAAKAPAAKADEAPAVDESLPAKLRGKSVAEVAAMYANLESAYGRMANDLGQQRRLTDRLLDLKRSEDLAANGGPQQVKPVTVDRAKLLEDPTAELTRFVEARESARESEAGQRLANLEVSLAQKEFVAKHPDYAEIAADPGFIAWVQGSPYRLRTAQTAYGGDWSAADELVSEYKERAQAPAAATEQQDKPEDAAAAAGIEAARRASLETGSDKGDGGKGGKVYRRIDLLALRARDPEAYYDEGLQAEILRAYAEGRVK